ncbi:hypothetical protein V8F06_002225 [Rhypophila decipiens]
MATHDAFFRADPGQDAEATATTPTPLVRPRRMSMDEDMFYRELMTSRPAEPPSYATAMRAALNAQKRASLVLSSDEPRDILPEYSCGVHMEGVFMRKMEIENTVKRAEYRAWQMVYVELNGTALNIYQVKKERGWWSSRHEKSDISPDSPPWVKKSTLEKSYSLLHADAGIAADYRKRRYVIRLRAETDQFLLSCVELPTFVTWLDGIFAAINVAAPIDERDFPRDQSIPRVQRIRWLRGQRPQLEDNSTGFPRLTERRESDAASVVSAENEEDGDDPPVGPTAADRDDEGPNAYGRGGHPIVGRLSTTSYPNENVDPDTGKWKPRHRWTVTHDQLYAKLCYAVLLFKSPRKSNYVISKGKRWYVDWNTGRMIRVLPPAYGEVELFGPWQIVTTENRFI